jgi:rhodanese-related sulfurtransferase
MAIPEIEVDELAKRAEAGSLRLIDVREPDEFSDGHVPGAVSVPLGAVPEQVDAFRGEGPTYVICRSGARSLRACQHVAEHGVEVVNVAGGTLAWTLSGRPVESGDS